MSTWDNTLAAFRACLDESSGEIDSLKFVTACEDIAHIYDALFSVGMMAKQLKSDITNSAGTVMKCVLKNPTKNATLAALVENEIKTNGKDKVRADRTNGVIGMLWAKRAVEFIMTYLELLGTRADLTSSQCARETYDRVLAKYHGWLTSKAIGAAMSLAPTKEEIFKRLEINGETTKALKEMVSVLRAVVSRIQAILDANDADFPDKV